MSTRQTRINCIKFEKDNMGMWQWKVLDTPSSKSAIIAGREHFSSLKLCKNDLKKSERISKF